MTRLFAEVYLDEDVSVLVASLLVARGFKAVTTRDGGQLGRSDNAQLDYAAGHGMLFLTHNRADFEALHRRYLAANQTHWGHRYCIPASTPCDSGQSSEAVE